MFRRNKLNNKTLNKIYFLVTITGLLFIFVTLYRYRQRALQEDYRDMIIENLDTDKDVKEKIDNRQNITKQPDPPTQEDENTPGYLELNQLSVPNVTNYVVRTVTNALQSVRPDVQGPPGLMGPRGIKGDSGGSYTHQGSLRFIDNPNLVLGRGTTKLTINNNSYKPDQKWTLQSDGRLLSWSGNNRCMSATPQGELKIDYCLTSKKWKYNKSTSQLSTVKPIGGSNKCLTLKNTPENGKDGQFNMSLENCVVGPDQAWSFG